VIVRLDARHLSFAYCEGAAVTPVIRDVTLSVGAGEFVGLVGPSGSGKSSLLFLLAGLRWPVAGVVCLDGRPWPRALDARADLRRRRLGLILQEPFLLGHLSVRENAAAHAVGAEAGARIGPLAEVLGIGRQLDRFPHQLATGERQRASVLRALVNAPSVVLADEPTSHLDHATGRQVIELMVRCAREASLLVATHDAGMLAAAHRVLRIADGTVVEE